MGVIRALARGVYYSVSAVKKAVIKARLTFCILIVMSMALVYITGWSLQWTYPAAIGNHQIFDSHKIIQVAGEHIGFKEAFSAAMLQSVISFIILTFGITLVQAIEKLDPKSEAITTRLSYLLNGKNIDHKTEVFDYMWKLLRKYTIYSPIYNYDITYGEYNSELNAQKVFVSGSRTLKNIMDDYIYSERELSYKIVADDVVDSEGKYGEILSAKLIYEGKIDEPKKSTQPILEQQFELRQDLEIKGSSSAESLFKFWLYHKIGEIYFITPQKYTRKLCVTVTNESSRLITLDFPKRKAKRLQTGESWHTVLTDKDTEKIELFRLL